MCNDACITTDTVQSCCPYRCLHKVIQLGLYLGISKGVSRAHSCITKMYYISVYLESREGYYSSVISELLSCVLLRCITEVISRVLHGVSCYIW